jgi:hypothetical protein
MEVGVLYINKHEFLLENYIFKIKKRQLQLEVGVFYINKHEFLLENYILKLK